MLVITEYLNCAQNLSIKKCFKKWFVSCLNLEVCMFTIEASFANPASTWALWAMRDDLHHVLFVHRIIFLLNAFHTESFDACPFDHHLEQKFHKSEENFHPKINQNIIFIELSCLKCKKIRIHTNECPDFVLFNTFSGLTSTSVLVNTGCCTLMYPGDGLWYCTYLELPTDSNED